jgi:hypothetical protein
MVAGLLTLLATVGATASTSAFDLNSGRLSGVRATADGDGLSVAFGAKELWPNIEWQAPDASGWDWSKSGALVFTVRNPGKTDASFHVKFVDHLDDGKKHDVTVSGMAHAGQTETFYMSLEPRTKRAASGMRALPRLPADPTLGTCMGSGVEPTHIDRVQIFRSNPKTEATIIIKSIELRGEPSKEDLVGIVDCYGQYTRYDWPGKIHVDADMVAQKTAEEADLKIHPGSADRDRWGGWASGPRQAATGFFRSVQIDGKWWLVDPDGALFISIGMDVVRPDLGTTVEGREKMFTWLPDASDPLASSYPPSLPGNKRTINFLRANRIRKYGSNDDVLFGDRAVARLKSWGFNTFGNWSKEYYAKERSFPYVVAIGTKGGFATVPTGIRFGGGKMPDPFDPAFAVDVEANVRAKVADAKDDPACIGYFFDNELGWGMPSVDKEHFGLCYGALGLSREAPAKYAFVGMLKSRYGTIEKLNAAWGTKAVTWSDVEAPFKAPDPLMSTAQRRDFSDYLSLFADKYFDVVSSTIKRYDSNHMYLGCRFAYWFTPEAVKSAAKYCDTISFNIYTWNREAYAFAEALGKPCIVGEFHFGATDRGMFSGDITVATQQERAAQYASYVASVLAEPAFVGCHWFQYFDEPTTGRSGDGENFNIGFLSITDTPYPELIDSARATNSQVYALHQHPAGVKAGK